MYNNVSKINMDELERKKERRNEEKELEKKLALDKWMDKSNNNNNKWAKLFALISYHFTWTVFLSLQSEMEWVSERG